MRTASWTTYTGPGRVALSPAPAGTPRGYRIGPAGLFVRTPVTPAALRARLADLDPRAVWSELHDLTYPHEPILTGGAAPGVSSLRTVISAWLAFNVGEAVLELDPETHRPRKVRPRVAALGLAAMILATPAARAQEAPRTWKDETGCVYLITPQGGITPRLLWHGEVDCPTRNDPVVSPREPFASTGVQDTTVKDLVRSVDKLQSETQSLRREVENVRRELERRR